MRQHARSQWSAVIAAGCVAACAGEDVDFLWAAPKDSGPRVQFDLLARPLPLIPFPNDIATRLDADSATGRRVNASVAAPTMLEQDVRAEFSFVDGFGTFSPITVAFESPIDPLDVRERHRDDDFANDAVYVVDLTTGRPVALDLGRGAFPASVITSNHYFDNDPRVAGSSLQFESYEEDANGNGVLDPGEDTDFDGVLDHPNTADPTRPLRGVAFAPRARPEERGNDVYRDLLPHYERQTNTLLIRPLVPLEQRRTYAVVLTRRIRGVDGKPVCSPFGGVNHAAQTAELAALPGFIDAGLVPGLTRADVAFTWAFTTQSVTGDLEQIRSGLYGEGPLARLGRDFPAKLEKVRYAPSADEPSRIEPLHPLVSDPAQVKAPNQYTLPPKVLTGVIKDLLPVVNPDWQGGGADLLIETYKFVDYIVMGSFRSPDFLDDPDKPTYDAVFRVNADKGLARVWQRPADWAQVETDALEAATRLAPNAPEMVDLLGRSRRAIRDRITFFLFVPKARPAEGITAPFPVAIYGHGYGSASFEALGFAGSLAKFGLATVCINDYGHGLPLSPVLRAGIVGLLEQYKLAPMGQAILDGRARDLNHDGTDDSGGDFWVANAFHTRDVVRQSVVDWMQLVRVFRGFGTYRMGDLDADGKEELAGDFNADGVIDVGGPEKDEQGRHRPAGDFFAFGESLGGIISSIVGAVEPAIVAAAPISSGGGLADVGMRTDLGRVDTAVFLETFGPLLVGQPVKDGVDLSFQLLDVIDDVKVKLNDRPLDIRPGDEVTVTNLDTDSGEPRGDRYVVANDGRFRLQVAADGPKYADDAPYDGDPVRVAACEDASVRASEASRLHLLRPADCLLVRVVRAGREVLRLDRFPKDVSFQGRTYPKDSPLVSLARGFGLKRQTPSFRRMMNLTASVLDPADPANYAKHYFLDPLPARRDRPLPVLIGGVAGDSWVPVATAYALGRSAGVLPYRFDKVRDAAWGMSPNDVLIRTGALEGIEQLRTAQPAADALRHPDAAVPPEDQAIVDLLHCEKPEQCEAASIVDVGLYGQDQDSGAYLDDGNDYFDHRGGVPRLKASLRTAAQATFTLADDAGKPVERHAAFLFPYLEPTGHHGFDIPHEQNPFDVELYMINMIGRFFQTRGAELHYETCMHRDGFDRRRTETGARRDPRCDWIPTYPTEF